MNTSRVDVFSQCRMWTREATTILIQQYQLHECMWMTTSPYYRNKQKRSEALINIALEVSKLRPQTSAEDIKNKINGIRTQYVSEINKLIIAAKRDKTYEPTLWCYDNLHFLKPFTQPKQRVNGTWPRTFMPKPYRHHFVHPLKPHARSQPHQQYHHHQPNQPRQPHVDPSQQLNRNCIIIKDEGNDNDVQIIEEEDNLNIEDNFNSHSSGNQNQENKSFSEEHEETNQTSSTSPEEEATRPATVDSGFEEEQTNKVRQLFSPCGIGAEITLVPAKNTTKRKVEETVEVTHVAEKMTKVETETNTDNMTDEHDNRINIFGRFVTSQMKMITDKVLLLKLEHKIQNAIIEAQLKQILIDESSKDKRDDRNNQN